MLLLTASLAIMGIIFLPVAFFYLISSWRNYGKWIMPVITIAVCFACALGGGWGFIQAWHIGHSSSAETPMTSAPTTLQSAQGNQSQPLVVTGMPQLDAAHEQAKTQQQILGDMQRTFRPIGTVSFDQQTKTYRIMPTSNQDVQAINYVLQNPEMAQKVGYNQLTGGIKQTAKNLQSALGRGYTYQLLKPGDTNTVIYSVRDGKVLVDIVNGIK
ncbi:hypothetical protein ACI3E1_07800 [Ligilactobacillus sp. LYQ139]|uniref:hypothetical protein n=1 Tax=Ligilactobacillus sp. LYQ139 TaxID=3378800 RepID=UPI0038547A1D